MRVISLDEALKLSLQSYRKTASIHAKQLTGSSETDFVIKNGVRIVFSGKVPSEEGLIPVTYKPGDMLCKGVLGEYWPQPLGEFEGKYLPAPPALISWFPLNLDLSFWERFPNQEGMRRYKPKSEKVVEAVWVDEAFGVLMLNGSLAESDGRGGWLIVQDGTLRILRNEVFLRTYTPVHL